MLKMEHLKETDKKIEILLHFEKSFREDWRFLHRTRVLVSGAFLAFLTSFIGWIITKYGGKTVDITLKLKLAIILFVFVGFASITLGWFASSLNVLKQFLVRIEESLGLFEKNVYLHKETLLPEPEKLWGQRGFWVWGKSVFGCVLVGIIIISLLFIML